MNYKGRHYSATIGRFTARDPLDDQNGAMNLYEYSGGRPNRFTDPTGLEFEDIPAQPSATAYKHIGVAGTDVGGYTVSKAVVDLGNGATTTVCGDSSKTPLYTYNPDSTTVNNETSSRAALKAREGETVTSCCQECWMHWSSVRVRAEWDPKQSTITAGSNAAPTDVDLVERHELGHLAVARMVAARGNELVITLVGYGHACKANSTAAALAATSLAKLNLVADTKKFAAAIKKMHDDAQAEYDAHVNHQQVDRKLQGEFDAGQWRPTGALGAIKSAWAF
jgi:hypothetical protein